MSFTPREPADYIPTRGNYTELKPFRFWCQKVLPLVYDDSLSYYELLCKVVDFLNKTMEDVETLEDDTTAMYSAYNQLQSFVNDSYNELVGFVNDYFDNLDVQNEIDNKLDEMASDGSLTNLLAPYIPDLVTEWMNEHITPTTPVIDNTLSISGAGADSKVTGNKIKSVIKALYGITGANNYEFINSYYIKTNEEIGDTVNLSPVTADPVYAYVIIPCNENDKFIINTVGGNAPRGWAFIDSNNVLISKSNIATFTDYLITAPEGSNKLIVNNISGDIQPTVYDFISLSDKINILNDKLTITNDSINSRTGLKLEEFINGGYINTNVSTGSTVNLSPVSGTTEYSYSIINCEEGDYFTVSAIGGNASRAWAFIDSSNKLLNKAENGANLTDNVLIAPKDSNKLVLNNISSTKIFYAYKGIGIDKQIDNINNTIGVGIFKNGVENFLVGNIENMVYSGATDTNDIPGLYPITKTPLVVTDTGAVLSDRTKFFDTVGYFCISVLCSSSSNETTFTLYARIKSPENTYRWKTVRANIPQNVETKIIVDLSHYAIYENAEKIAFIITSDNTNNVERTIVLTENCYVTKYKTLETFGETIGEWFENINNSIVNNISNSYRSANFKVSPNGTKYVEQVSNNGEYYNVSVIPTKTLFIGNSLLLGFDFGMCASDNTKDYYALFNSYVNNISNMVSNRISGVDWETANTILQKNTWISQNITSELLNDVDLIVIQLGDNSPLEQEDIYFESCVNLISAIRAIVPTARVCWVGSWYSQSLMKYVESACQNTGAIFVNITNLVSAANKGYYGQIVHFNSAKTTQYNLTNYTENGDGTITIEFTADGRVYEETIPYNYVSESGETVNINSEYYVVTKAGVAGHPGDRGFRAITNKLLYDLYISDLVETYALD